MRAWAEAEAKENAEIIRVAAQARNKSKDEAEERYRSTLRESENSAKSAVEEDVTEIRDGAEAEGAERDREEAEERAWAEAEIREETERTRAEAGTNTKAGTDAAERARV